MPGNFQVTSVDFDNYYISNNSVVTINDKVMWTWGGGSNGVQGVGDITARSFPNLAGGYSWSSLNTGPAGAAAGITKNNTLYVWGQNGSGQLGLGDIIHRSYITQVGTLNNWSKVSTSLNNTCSVKTDGTLWTWGLNTNGQLGDGTVTPKSSPVQVGALTNWASASCGGDGAAGSVGFIVAVKTDGTLWSWGGNGWGQLGQGDIVHRSSPVQVGALTTWASVSAGGRHTLAIKTDGTLWAWGYNASASWA